MLKVRPAFNLICKPSGDRLSIYDKYAKLQRKPTGTLLYKFTQVVDMAFVWMGFKQLLQINSQATSHQLFSYSSMCAG